MVYSCNDSFHTGSVNLWWKGGVHSLSNTTPRSSVTLSSNRRSTQNIEKNATMREPNHPKVWGATVFTSLDQQRKWKINSSLHSFVHIKMRNFITPFVTSMTCPIVDVDQWWVLSELIEVINSKVLKTHCLYTLLGSVARCGWHLREIPSWTFVKSNTDWQDQPADFRCPGKEASKTNMGLFCCLCKEVYFYINVHSRVFSFVSMCGLLVRVRVSFCVVWVRVEFGSLHVQTSVHVWIEK